MERRLAAILAADVVGYSRLVREDEVGTLSALKALREALIEPKLGQYHGRIVKLMGDGLLAEFSSAVEAVRCAVEIQHLIGEGRAGAPDGPRITYRMGINIGDVVVEDDDIYGDGVNIAARLEGLAEAGGICLSRTVLTHVKDKLDLTFEHLGERQVKNIAEPVSVYRVVFDEKARALVTSVVRATGKPQRRWWPWAAAVLALAVVAVTAVLWWAPWQPGLEPASMARMAFPLPDKPSIAVLPFANLSDDPSQDYFADGMSEDLITDLSKISGLFVIARNSSFAYKGQAVKLHQVAEELGVRYVLEGSVRRVGEQVRINTQLIDAVTGGHVWAERYDRKLDNIFEVQDAIRERVVQALELHLTSKDQRREDAGPKTTSMEAYDLVLKARKLMSRFDRKASREAQELLARAVDLDPAYAEAYSLLGFSHFDEWRVWGRKRDANLARALELAKKAAELNPADPAPHVLSALVYQWRRAFDEANAAADKAIAREPRDAITLSSLGSMLTYAGRGEEAVAAMNQAIRVDPFHPPTYLEWLGNAYWLVGEAARCVDVAERGVAIDPDYVSLHVVLAVCYGTLGREKEARAAAAEILRINPRFTLKGYAAYVPYTEPRHLQARLELMRQAGVPE